MEYNTDFKKGILRVRYYELNDLVGDMSNIKHPENEKTLIIILNKMLKIQIDHVALGGGSFEHNIESELKKLKKIT